MPTPKNTVKQWFETADTPTQDQFYALFDSIRWLADGIDIADVNGLVNALQGKADTATIQALQSVILPDVAIYHADFNVIIRAGRELEKIRFYPAANITLTVGTTNFGGELLPG